MISVRGALTGAYNFGEVARSELIVIAASYAAFDLAGRVSAASGKARTAWLAGGAIAMGIGIWEMQFRGLVAFRLPVPVPFYLPTVIASLIIAILSSAVALCIVTRRESSVVDVWGGSLVMGVAIVSLHCVNIAAIRLPVVKHLDLRIGILSLAIAIVLSFAGLELTFGMRDETKGTAWRRVTGAIVMGAAISLTHFVSMSGTTFVPAPVLADLSHTVSISPLVGSGVSIITLIVLVAAILTSAAEREAKDEVRQLNEGLFRQVADSAPVLIWMSGPDKLCTYFNKPWLDFTGRPIEAELGDGWAEMVHPEDLARCLETYRGAFDRRETFRMTYRHRRHDGEYRWILDSGVPRYNPDQSFAGYIGSAIDVTEHRRAEEQLQRAQSDMGRITRVTAMGELVAAIAHEVNQPLTAIVTNANFCMREFGSGSFNPDKIRDAIMEIASDGTRASAIITRIRALLQKGSPPERVTVNIGKIVEEALLLLRGELSNDKVHVKTNLYADLPAVLGDRVQLQQLVINLILNGIEAMRSRAIQLRELVICSSRHADEVLVQVQDNGDGIDASQRQNIFEPFVTSKPGGIGMGLTISRSIVESHGGRLWAESTSTGTIFQFTLPIQR